MVRTAFTWECPSPVRPGLRVEAGRGGRISIVQDDKTIVDAVVSSDGSAVQFERVASYRSPLPPLRARQARAAHPDPDGNRWAHRFVAGLSGNPLGPLHSGTWLATDHRPHDDMGQYCVDPDDDEINWFQWPWHGGRVLTLDELRVIPLLPLRRLSPPVHDRVKAYRRLSQEGMPPPVLAWWVSGLFALVVLDGHDRLMAALAEDRPPRIVTLGLAVGGDVVDGEVAQAVRNYDAIVERAKRYPLGAAVDAADRGLTAKVAAAGLRFGRTRAFGRSRK
ncbi:MAG: hypothetical protein ACRD0P_10150 [Stackebrandtia sp.]